MGRLSPSLPHEHEFVACEQCLADDRPGQDIAVSGGSIFPGQLGFDSLEGLVYGGSVFGRRPRTRRKSSRMRASLSCGAAAIRLLAIASADCMRKSLLRR